MLYLCELAKLATNMVNDPTIEKLNYKNQYHGKTKGYLIVTGPKAKEIKRKNINKVMFELYSHTLKKYILIEALVVNSYVEEDEVYTMPVKIEFRENKRRKNVN